MLKKEGMEVRTRKAPAAGGSSLAQCPAGPVLGSSGESLFSLLRAISFSGLGRHLAGMLFSTPREERSF